MKKPILGVDIGNVIIDHRGIMDTADESWWKEKYSTIPPAEDVFDCLRDLNKNKFKDGIFLVSKLKEEHDSRTLAWLKDNKFFEKTGISPEHLFFCRERSDKVKICKKNNITHFIDDRLEILGYMVNQIPNLYLFDPDPEEVEEFKQFLPKVVPVRSWRDFMGKIMK